MLSKLLSTAHATGIKLDQRTIKKLIPINPAEEKPGCHVHFTDNTSTYVGFLTAKPDTEPTNLPLLRSLGLELSGGPGPMGLNLKRAEPFGTTDVPGVLVCGDAGTPAKSVTGAMAQGGFVAAGIAHALCDEDDEATVMRLEEARGKEEVEVEVDVPKVDGVDGTGCAQTA